MTVAQERVVATPTPMLAADQVAAILNCSTRTVYRLVDSGRMPPPCRLGGLVRWNAAVLDAWIAAGCPAPAKQADRQIQRK